MQVQFLLGPAGSGKTFRCLTEIREELIQRPEGSPLLLLAPKQATFQLERQLLADGRFGGYTRLQILSFDRFARFLIGDTRGAQDWLDDEGRVMVLRSLLAQKRPELKLFHATARLPGFATRLSLLLRELQRHQLSPARLRSLSEKLKRPVQLRNKLQDFALIMEAYLDWLKANQLQDGDGVLDQATALLRDQSGNLFSRPVLRLSGLWLDGFAEMTAQELDLLAALVPLCDRATLAFCLDGEPKEDLSWLSTWSVIGQTFLRCRERLKNLSGAEITTEVLPRVGTTSRFARNPELAMLESSWARPVARSVVPNPNAAVRPDAAITAFACANPEAEAVLAAREIRRFVSNGGRYREAAVLVRSLDGYAATLRRVFDRYEIPHFMDRREPVSHHPLAELTRYALRLSAYGWRRDDWFGALKTGLMPVDDTEIDRLENMALEFGWDGELWLQPLALPDNPSLAAHAEKLRQRLIPPFAELAREVGIPLCGARLAKVLQRFWDALEIEKTLGQWSDSLAAHGHVRLPHTSLHSTVWEQMQVWLDNLALAFPDDGPGGHAMSAREWLPILESGLALLTVGVIPPALDQVTIGAIDRSRNPELKLAIVMGLNEGVFPQRPADDPLLTEAEREALLVHGARMGLGARQRVGHEWFYGYIACTRATDRLVLTCAESDDRGNKLNRSPFFDHIERVMPGVKLTSWKALEGFEGVEHIGEAVAPAVRLFRARQGSGSVEATKQLFALPQLAPVLAKAQAVLTSDSSERLSPVVLDRLYGREIPTSISALEEFAACPFKFFIARGLRAEERREFELDSRERGSFQHEILDRFHKQLKTEGLKWRDITPEQARERVRRIGSEHLPQFRRGLFTATAASRFAGDMLLSSVETLVAVLITWARDYRFDPEFVEAGFGLRDSRWPAWRLDVGDGYSLKLRGRIDRVDVARDPVTGAALVVVMDYKSSSRNPDRLKLHHGLQLQLPTYLAALEHLPEVRATLGADRVVPAGVFYVNLRGGFASAKTRDEATADPGSGVRDGFKHAGRYDERFLAQLDPRESGEQFKTGSRALDRMKPPEFRALLERAVGNLQHFGAAIFGGCVAPDPYRKGAETACDHCDYASVCRFDPWTQPFRTLKDPKAETGGEAES